MDKNGNGVTLLSAQMEELAPLIEQTVQSGGAITVYPRGVSMLPMLRQGKDSVILSAKQGKLKKYDIPLYKRANGSYVLHRIVKVTESGYTCTGDNQIALEKGVTDESIIAVVSAFTRNGKRYSVKNIRYKIYCRVWHFTRPIRRVWRKLKRTLGIKQKAKEE